MANYPKCPIDNSRLIQKQVTVNDNGFLLKKWVFVCYQHGVTEINRKHTQQLTLEQKTNKCQQDGSDEKICLGFLSPEPAIPFTSPLIKNLVCEYDGHLFTCHYPCKKCDLQYPACVSMEYVDDIHYSKIYDRHCVHCNHLSECHARINEDNPYVLNMKRQLKTNQQQYKINKQGTFEAL